MNTLYLGYAREDFTPDKPVRMNSQRTGVQVLDPIFATALSLSDGDRRVLILALDLRNIYSHFTEVVIPMITEATGVPGDHIILTSPHNHSCPDISSTNDESVLDWRERIGIPAIIRAARAAVADEKEVTGMAGGTCITDKINYVRRYQREDGSWWGIASANPSKAPIVKHESQADPQLRAVRITRQGGKDVIMVNFQTHAASALSQHKDAVCADFVGPLRDRLEAQTGGLVVYLQGACGNTNYTPRIKAEKETSLWAYEKVGEAMADYALKALKNAKPLQPGKLQLRTGTLACYVNHTKDHLVPQIQQICDAEEDPDVRMEKLQAIGIASRYERGAVIKRANKPETEEMELAALSLGDLAMTFCPVEMFDTNGLQLRSASPYPMTFNCGYSLNYRGYMPSHPAWPHGEYEVYMCHYLPGTGESIVLAHLAQLQDMHTAQ